MKYIDSRREKQYRFLEKHLTELGQKVEVRGTGAFESNLICPALSSAISKVDDTWWVLHAAHSYEFRNVDEIVRLFEGGTQSWEDQLKSESSRTLSATERVNALHRMRTQELAGFGWSENTEPDAALDLFWEWYEANASLPCRELQCSDACTWDISIIYRVEDDEREVLESEFTLAALAGLRACCQGGSIQVVDRWHPTFNFTPNGRITDCTLNQWATPIVPFENARHFVDPHFEFGILGNYRANTITVFGDRLLEAFTTDTPRLLAKPIKPTRNTRVFAGRADAEWTRLLPPEFKQLTDRIENDFEGYPLAPTDLPYIRLNYPDLAAIDLEKLKRIMSADVFHESGWLVLEHESMPAFSFQPGQESELSDWPIEPVPSCTNPIFISDREPSAVLADNKSLSITLCGNRLLRMWQENTSS